MLAAAACVSTAAGNFADSAGFSGRAGATCTSCHTMPDSLHPAQAHLDGLPASWVPGTTYALHVSVTGGPPALPPPAPQGGFDLAVSIGHLGPATGFTDLLRAPDPSELTYLPAGALMRSWNVTWTTPRVTELEDAPGPALVWLAALAADGNHVVATNASDGGERFDAMDAVRFAVPAAPSAQAAWKALPLPSPHIDRNEVRGGQWQVEGTASAVAQTLVYSLDDGAPHRRATGPHFELDIALGPGAHVLRLQVAGAGRTSPPLILSTTADGAASSGAPSHSAAAAAAALPILLSAFLRRRR